MWSMLFHGITMSASFIESICVFFLLLSPINVALSSENRFTYANNCNCVDSFIDCSNRNLSKVPSDLPSWTKVLKLNKNFLSEMPFFTSAQNLTQLNLGHNRLISVSKTALESVSSLEILELNNNDLRRINKNDFPLLEKLQNLNLNHNEISRIEDEGFDGLTNLIDLKLNRNKLSQLNTNLFKKLNKLRTLELNKNQFFEMEYRSFQGLNSLIILKLRQNNISELADGAFYTLFNLRELYLDYNKLSSVSKSWLYGLERLSHLNISNNNINSLNSGWDFNPQLKELDISNNELHSIQRLTFEHLSVLETLKLENNHIMYIEDGAFEYLSSLRLLDLSNNHVSWMVENTNGVFVYLKELNRLSLTGNNISHVSKDAFIGLENLVYLDLSNNSIASVEDNPFVHTPKLEELILNSSSLICDCTLKWFKIWLSKTKVKVRSESLSCVYPSHLKNKPLREVSPEEFVCVPNDHPQPHITIHPEDKTSSVGSNVTLRCGANSSLDSDMNFLWKVNNHRLDNASAKRYESAQNDGVTQFSELILTSVTMSQSGIYQCIVSNSYGVAYSKFAELSVLVFPTFVKTPANVVAKVGSTARLECSATGTPTPRIQWQKDDGAVFPAAQEKRMQIMDANEPFFIVNVKLIDSGVYTCMAKNAAGVITANATLTVLEAPTFTKEMKHKKVKLGEAVVLECMAAGSPKPKITWYKDNKPLSVSKRHFLAADDQLLFISEVLTNDMGVYECELSNELGYVRGRSKLIILDDHYLHDKEDKDLKDVNYEVVVLIVITTLVLGVVITSVFWVIVIYLTRKNRRTLRTPLSPIDMKSENSSHSSKDSGTGDSTKRSYQDLLITTGNANHSSIMHGNHSESPSPVPESTLPLLTTFHPISVDSSGGGSPYLKDSSSSSLGIGGTCSSAKSKHLSSALTTPLHYQSGGKQQQMAATLPPPQLDHSQNIFCASSPASSNGVQCACLTATFKKKPDVCDCLLANNSPVKHSCMVNHYGGGGGGVGGGAGGGGLITTANELDISCYGDIGKRPCSIPVPFHSATANCCRHHPNSYLCLYMPPGQQHGMPQ